MAPRVKDSKRVEAGRKAAVTRSARARGVDPARAWAARKGWETRRNRAEYAARLHGQKAREKTERALTPAQRGARTREANRIKRETHERAEPLARGKTLTGLAMLDDEYDEYPEPDDIDYEAEGHQETTGKRARGR
jgi:hypothetical protein